MASSTQPEGCLMLLSSRCEVNSDGANKPVRKSPMLSGKTDEVCRRGAGETDIICMQARKGADYSGIGGALRPTVFRRPGWRVMGMVRQNGKQPFCCLHGSRGVVPRQRMRFSDGLNGRECVRCLGGIRSLPAAFVLSGTCLLFCVVRYIYIKDARPSEKTVGAAWAKQTALIRRRIRAVYS